MARRKRSKADLCPRSTVLAEWVAAGLGAVVVALMIGGLIWYGISDGAGAPDITVSPTGAPERVSSGYRVAFIARNAGGITAARLNIEGVLRIDGRVVERATSTMDYLPGHSERRGGLFFRRDPREGELSIDPTGYEEP